MSSRPATVTGHAEIMARLEAHPHPIRTLILGDSLVASLALLNGVDNAHAGSNHEPPVKLHEDIFLAGVGGDKIENLQWRVMQPGFLDHEKFHSVTSVVIHIGANSIGAKPDYPALFKSYGAILENVSVHLPQATIILDNVSNRYSADKKRASFAEQVKKFNTLLRDAYGEHFTIVDVHSLIDDSLLYDHVHYTIAGYEKWYHELAKALSNRR